MKLHDFLSTLPIGGRSELAARVGVSRAYLYQMATARRSVSPERAAAIERATDGAVTCEELRPDVDWAYLRSTGPRPAVERRRRARRATDSPPPSAAATTT